MATLRIPTAPVFRPLLEPARYKGAYGGRGSGKSHFFGELMVERCLVSLGTLAVCIREVQKSLLQSSKRLIESKIQSLGVGAHFQVLHDRIVTPGDGLACAARGFPAPISDARWHRRSWPCVHASARWRGRCRPSAVPPARRPSA